MVPAVVVSNVSKTFRRYHPDRPATIQEAIAKGLRDFYRGSYQAIYMSRRQDVEKAVTGT